MSAIEHQRLLSSEKDARAAAETALAALAKSEARFRSIVETTTEWVWAADLEGRTTYSNAAIESILGYTAEEVLGRDSFELMHPEDREHVLPLFREYIERKMGWSGLVVRWRHRDGSYRYLESKGVPILGRSGDLEGFRGSDRDVTERIEAEESVRAAEEKYRNLVEELPLVTYIRPLDMTKANIYVSPQVEDLFGYPAEQWETDPDLLARIVHPDDREHVLAECAHVRQTGEPFELEYRYVTADGRIVWVRDETRLVRDGDGKRLYVQGYLVDITERIAAEDALVESEGRFRTLVASMPGAVFRCIYDGAWRTEFISSPIEDISGYAAGEFFGDEPRTLSSLIHPDDFDRVVEEFEHAALEGRTYAIEYRMTHRDGSVRWVVERGRGQPRSDGTRLLDGVIFDSTERHEAQQAVRDSEERFRTLVSNIPGAIYRCACDADWTMEFISEEVAAITGYPASDFVNRLRSYASVIHPDDRKEVERVVYESVREERPYVLEYRVVAPDGRVRWVYEKGQAVLGPDGQPLWLDGAIFDVTERKQIEAERERLLERLVEAEKITHLGSWAWEVAANRVTWSDEMFQIWGLDPVKFGASYEAFRETVHPDDRSFVDAHVKEALITGGFECEYRIVRRDGGERFIHARARVQYDESGTPVTMIGTTQDITERKEIETERERLLTQAQAQNARLRELDRLKDTFVASVSHELRTPLTSISGFLQLMRDGIAGATTEEQRRCLAIASRNADRLHRLIGDLLFVAQLDAGQLVLEPTQVDLRAVAAECLESARPRAVQAGVDLVLGGDPVDPLEGDQSRLTQLLENLVSNAIKFSVEGGRVAVRTLSQNGNVVLEVADQGIGIPAAQRQHLFRRFFRGSNAAERAIQGTGIGLSIVKAIVDAHGGSIDVDSEEGEGTTFRVELPLKMPAATSRPKRVEAA